jgi:hypothetical protein
MTIDTEMETWREVWQSPSGAPERLRNFDIRRAVKRKKFRLKMLRFLEFAWALFLLGFSFEIARHIHTTEMYVWALVIWISTVCATAYSIWNWHSLWQAEPKSASEYVQAYKKHCVAGLQQIRFGYYFLAVSPAITVPWLTWKFFRSETGKELSLIAYSISMGLVAGLTAGYLFWFSRSRKNRLRELEQLRQYQQILNEEGMR